MQAFFEMLKIFQKSLKVWCLLYKEFICSTTDWIQHYKFQASKVDQMIRSGTFQISFSEILGYPAI